MTSLTAAGLHDRMRGLSVVRSCRPCLGGRSRVVLGLSILLPILLAACEEAPLPPTAPSSLPSERVQVLALACPRDVAQQSLDGRALDVEFAPPLAQGGLAPIVTECSPASGAPFEVGTHMVTCSAQDGLSQVASCMLSVTVIPTLNLARILAFGDSLTAGVTASPVQSIVQLEPNESYPTKLAAMLRERYAGQNIRVANSGVPGERATEALSRFRSELAREQPDLVLLMEGSNDLDAVTTVAGDAAARSIEDMVLDAKSRGVDVMLATIPPQRSVLATAPQVAPYNQLIREIAARRNVPLIDVHRIVVQGQCSNLGNSPLSFPCLGDDHLHPTREGNELIAIGFFEEIAARFENGPGGAGPLGGPTGLALPPLGPRPFGGAGDGMRAIRRGR